MTVAQPSTEKNPTEHDKTSDITQLKPNNIKQQKISTIYIDDKGYVQNANFTHSPISALEKGKIEGPHAIILHRTESPSASSAITSFKNGVGTHFLVDKDGTVTQTASLLQHTYHIGKIKSKCYENKTCPIDEMKKIKGYGWSPQKVYDHEKDKDYPTRYPINLDSIGIEVVGQYNESTKKWDEATESQLKSIAKIVKLLKKEYSLTDDDIYEHDKISYKTAGEGAGLYDSNNDYSEL